MCWRAIANKKIHSLKITLFVSCILGVSAFPEEVETTKNSDKESLVLRHEMYFSWIPPGKKIGKDQSGAGTEIKQDEGFYCGVFEVTQGDWRRIVGEDFENVLLRQEKGRVTTIPRFLDDSIPVYCLTIDDAESFLEKVNQRELEKYGEHSWTFRLPSATEWEYAARSFDGEESVTGNTLDIRAGVFWPDPDQDRIKYLKFHGNTRFIPGPEKVGTRSIENVHRLHDIHGNVSELTTTPSNERHEDIPDVAALGPFWVTKGGGWKTPRSYCLFSKSGFTGRNSANLSTGMRLFATKKE